MKKLYILIAAVLLPVAALQASVRLDSRLVHDGESRWKMISMGGAASLPGACILLGGWNTAESAIWKKH